MPKLLLFTDTTFRDEAANKVSMSPQAVHQCAHCPFTCVQKSRLLRHENKHLVEAEHKVGFFDFLRYLSSFILSSEHFFETLWNITFCRWYLPFPVYLLHVFLPFNGHVEAASASSREAYKTTSDAWSPQRITYWWGCINILLGIYDLQMFTDKLKDPAATAQLFCWPQVKGRYNGFHKWLLLLTQ